MQNNTTSNKEVLKELLQWSDDNNYELTEEDLREELDYFIKHEGLNPIEVEPLIKEILEYQDEQIAEIEWAEDLKRQEEDQKEWFRYLNTLSPSEAQYLRWN